jgi:hypothetical protein
MKKPRPMPAAGRHLTRLPLVGWSHYLAAAVDAAVQAAYPGTQKRKTFTRELRRGRQAFTRSLREARRQARGQTRR